MPTPAVTCRSLSRSQSAPPQRANRPALLGTSSPTLSCCHSAERAHGATLGLLLIQLKRPPPFFLLLSALGIIGIPLPIECGHSASDVFLIVHLLRPPSIIDSPAGALARYPIVQSSSNMSRRSSAAAQRRSSATGHRSAMQFNTTNA